MKETAYLLQATLISAWWVGLFTSNTFFAAFQFDTIPPVAFWSFFAPDILLIASLSTIRAYRHSTSIELIVFGAFSYASLYCLNATILTGTGLLPTLLMLLGLAYNTFLCFSPLLFRTSGSKSLVVNASKTIIQILCIWFLALVVIPFMLLESFEGLRMPSMGVAFWLSLAAFAGFSLLGLTSSYFMVRDGRGTPLPLDQTNELVLSGPYRFVRNPMAIAGIGQGLAIAALFQSISILLYSLLGAVVWQLVVRPIEERDMVERFGEPYVSYRKRVSCWLPTFRRNSTL
jgi:protein-S-isoprenylcysteine O-methyltransferase Ste14